MRLKHRYTFPSSSLHPSRTIWTHSGMSLTSPTWVHARTTLRWRKFTLHITSFEISFEHSSREFYVENRCLLYPNVRSFNCISPYPVKHRYTYLCIFPSTSIKQFGSAVDWQSLLKMFKSSGTNGIWQQNSLSTYYLRVLGFGSKNVENGTIMLLTWLDKHPSFRCLA